MGASSSFKKQNYLSTEEVDKTLKANSTLQNLFNKYKNSDGFITIYELDRITNKLLDIKILKKLIQITASKANKISYDDFKYMYALFYTDKFEAKLNFLCDFIFIKNQKVPKISYVKKVNKYFNKSAILNEIFFHDSLINNNQSDSTKIEKSKVISFIKEKYQSQIENFTFLTQKNQTNNVLENNNPETLSLKNDNVLILKENNSQQCSCMLKSHPRENSKDSCLTPLQYKEYDKLEKEFRNYEKLNNGIFPIDQFEFMLTEINVNQSLVNIIGNYLRKKTQKSFLNFDLFKEMLIMLNPSSNSKEEISKGLFTLFSYPKNYIKKNTFFIFVKSTKPELSSKEITQFFDQFQIGNNIEQETFNDIVQIIIKELLESFEHIKYLQYIFFKAKTPDKSTDKNCIEILLQGKQLKDYIKDKITKEDKFYVIDAHFWQKWNDYVKELKPMKKNEMKNIRINTNKISDKNGKITEGLVYLKDYLLITSKMYELFTFWYGPPLGPELKRTKIFISSSNTLTLESKGNKKMDIDDDNSDDEGEKLSRNITSPFTGIDLKTSIKFEIEIFPVFLLFFNFDDLQKKNKTFSGIKENLKQSALAKNSNSRYYPFSRQTKFNDLLKPLEESINVSLEIDKTRLWIYYQGKFEFVNYNHKLEDEGITNSAIIVLEIYSNNHWPSEKIKKDTVDKKNKNNLTVGLINIGNTCYLNSILQTFLNNVELKDILLKEQNNDTFLNFLTNKKTEGKLVKEFISLLREKWQGEKKTIIPKKFKEICGEYNEVFKDFEQQDAHDFFDFLLDALHEDVNIKCNKTKIKNSEEIDTNELALGNEYWANTIRNNASYIHSLYLGQLKSTLTCNKCQKSKISFEPFTSLSLPIPEDSKMIMDIILFRLPFTLKPYYDSIHQLPTDFNINIRSSLKKIRSGSIGIYLDESDCSSMNQTINEVSNRNPQKGNDRYSPKRYGNEQLTTVYFDQHTKRISIKKKNENVFSNALNMNIPIRIKLEIGKKEKCQKLIELLKQMTELELEIGDKFTYFLITNNGNYVDENLLIDECFAIGQKAFIYEVLNYSGINKVFDYIDNENGANDKLIPLQTKEIQGMLCNPIYTSHYEIKNDISNVSNTTSNNNNSNTNINNQQTHINTVMKTFIIPAHSNTEIITPIVHRYRSNKSAQNDCFLTPQSFEYIDTYPDYILLTTTNAIKPINLYELIWEKYEYFLDTPTKYENCLWWKGRTQSQNNNPIVMNGQGKVNAGCDSIKPCSPFVLKMISKKTKSCVFCPWFKFCSGCIVDPHNMNYISVTHDVVIVTEWCRELYFKEIHFENRMLILNHSSVSSLSLNNYNYESKNNKISLLECFKLFTEKEEIKDIFCEKCNEKTTFKKSFEIERFPKYLVLALKRFKYTKIYKQKIDTLITFPTNELDLQSFSCKFQSYHPLFDLYAVVNHSGTLSGGHYSTILKHNNNWFKYDDSYVVENDEKIESKAVYILMYKMKTAPKNELYFDYKGLIDTAYALYLKQENFDNDFNFSIEENEDNIAKVIEKQGKSKYYYGEPVMTEKGNGYLENIYSENGELYAKVKLNKGYCKVNINNKQIKETLKNEVLGTQIESVPIKKKNNAICGKCSIF